MIEAGWTNLKIEPCVGCGYCCMAATCVVGLDRYGFESRRCPGLHFEKGRYWCRLITEETSEGAKALASHNLCIGAGCSSSLCNTQRDACRKGMLETYLEQQRRSAFDS